MQYKLEAKIVTSKKFAIGFERILDLWGIVYGDHVQVENWLIARAGNTIGYVFGEVHTSEEKMMKQLEYYQKEYSKVLIFNIEEIVNNDVKRAV
jgi:hypothetical protein